MTYCIRAMNLLICVNNEGYEASLEARKVYRRIDDVRADGPGLVRVVDESGEDYLYPADRFQPMKFEFEPKAAMLEHAGKGADSAGCGLGDRKPARGEDMTTEMTTSYEKDVVAWANEQAALLRAGNLANIDVEHIAQEIEDVGKSEQRELANRMAVLLAHLLKWQYQPARRGSSWRATIKAQRVDVAYLLGEAPSLKPRLADAHWMRMVWTRAVAQAVNETGIAEFPETCPWAMEQALAETFFPE